MQQLAVWGLRGITTLDATLSPSLTDGVVSLRRGNAPRCSNARRLPANSAEGWGGLVSDLAATAWTNSPAIQAAGSQAVITTFFDEMFNHLDPYSRYVAPEAADEDRARRSGEAGAGLLISQVRQNFVIQTVNADGPAAEAGIVAGDQIVAVDEQPTQAVKISTRCWVGSPVRRAQRSR